ncbi:TPA: WG repeat-containing protein [Citrobacter braakii]
MRLENPFLYFIALFLFFFSMISSAASEDTGDEYETGLEDISALTLPEATTRLDQVITELSQNLTMLDKMKNIRIEPGEAHSEPSSREDEEYQSAFGLLTKKEVEPIVAKELKAPLAFLQNITTSGSEIVLGLDALNDILARAQIPDSNHAFYYTLQNITFTDGSETNAAEIRTQNTGRSPESDGEKTFHRDTLTLPVTKPIAKMRLKLTYNAIPDYKKIVLNREHTETTLDNGERYRLIQMEEGEVSLLINVPKDALYIVEGRTPEGKVLKMRGQSSSSLPSDEAIKRLRTYYQHLVETRDNIGNYPDTQQLQTHLDSLLPKGNSTGETLLTTNLTIRFRGRPESVMIYRLAAPQETTLTKEVVNRDAMRSLYIAQDSETKRYGFIDKSGKWQIKPQFEDIQPTPVGGLYNMSVGDQSLSDGLSSYYFIDDKKFQLSEAPFQNLGAGKVIADSLILVEVEDNGSYGVYDIKRHQFTIPMKYVDVKIVDNLFIASLGEKTYGFEPRYGVLTLQGKEILPFRFSGIEKVGDLIYATTENNQRDTYTLSGKKVNPKTKQ